MTQREAIADFIDKSRPKFNQMYFTRDEDGIIEQLMSVIYSCERNHQYFTIKVDSYRVVEDYDEVNRILYEYYENLTKNKAKSKKRDNQYGYINLNESYIKLLIVRYYIKDRTDEDYLEVIIAIPRIVDKIYFKINGIMRSTLFQIVDNSTYNNGTSTAKTPSITLKLIFMAVRITKYSNAFTTTEGEELKLTYYHSRIFNKGIPAVKYIFAKFGYYGAIKFLGLEGAIYLTHEDPKDDTMYTFKVHDSAYVSAPKIIFNQQAILQSVVCTICNCIVDGVQFEEIFDPLYWVRSLGLDFSGGGVDKLAAVYNGDDSVTDPLEKGYCILDSFESIYDVAAKENIRLPMEDKETTYHIVRWIMREFNRLRLKSNLDIGCKRIRFAEYIASLYAFKIAKGIYRLSDMNKKVSVISIQKAIRTDPNYLIKAITKSNMVVYRNMVSDMDSMQALKYTYKGISGLGEGSNQSIPDIYRSIHHSHIGRLDLDSSSDGNPGITGTLCPYAPNYDGFFQDYSEPNFWEESFMETMEDYKNALNLKEALIFEEKLLGNNKEQEIADITGTITAMQKIISPMIFANEGELITLGEEI